MAVFSFGFHSTFQENILQLLLVVTYLSDTTDYDTHLFCFTHGEFSYCWRNDGDMYTAHHVKQMIYICFNTRSTYQQTHFYRHRMSC